MSILVEAKKEHRKVSEEIVERQHRLQVLETMLREYGVSFHPGTQKLYELVMECLTEHDGHASFNDIVAHLLANGIAISRQKISVVLTKNEALTFDRKAGQWQLAVT